MLRAWMSLPLWVLVAVLIAGCSAISPTRNSSGLVDYARPTAAAKHEHDRVARIHAYYLSWSGTPHRWGGNSRAGVDCSGFVQRVFRDLFDRQLPRSTRLQADVGYTVSPDALRPGDLVFFNIPHKVRHVGVYLSDGKFVHASTSKGVIQSSLASPYWRKHYWKTQRLLN